MFRGAQQRRDLLDVVATRDGRRCDGEALRIGQRRHLGQPLFLHRHVEAHIGRRPRHAPGQVRGPHEDSTAAATDAGWSSHFDIGADQRALVLRRVQPVDPGPPRRGIDRPGGPQDHHRHAVAPGVVDRHGAVHQPDIGVQDHGHRPLGHLGVAMGDGDRMLLVKAQQHLRPFVAEMVDEAVMQPRKLEPGFSAT